MHGQDAGPIFLSLNPFRKFGMDEARNFKFDTRIDLGKSHLTSDQCPQNMRD